MRKVLSPNNYGNKLKEDGVSRQQRITVNASFGKTSSDLAPGGAMTRQPPHAGSTDQSRNQSDLVKIPKPGSMHSRSKEVASSEAKTDQAEKILAEFAQVEAKPSAILGSKPVQPSVFRLPHNPIGN